MHFALSLHKRGDTKERLGCGRAHRCGGRTLRRRRICSVAHFDITCLPLLLLLGEYLILDFFGLLVVLKLEVECSQRVVHGERIQAHDLVHEADEVLARVVGTHEKRDELRYPVDPVGCRYGARIRFECLI
jgi:hypothetical protein